ncbi:MAG TPA: haloalkane dehalogenase [Candidatus Binataceae bacterium]|nr:haloalkane dehalogenase [Candidatus Binataceae bacterium]
MSDEIISAADRYPRKRVTVDGVEMAYVDTGENSSAEPIVFLHGNPTSSYLWRNVIPYLEGLGRCLAPDLVGMGDSGKEPNGAYRFVDHARYLDGWFEALGLNRNVTLVVHDWGSALGFHWAYRNQANIRGIAYMEAIVRPLKMAEWPLASQRIFQGLRGGAGDEMVLEKNLFVERILPGSVIRKLTDQEMAVYRKPYIEAGESRRPTLTWPRQIPFDGEPADVTAIVSAYAEWLKSSSLPKLFINADPGAILIGTPREFCRQWPNQRGVTVKGSHFIQEDSPHAIGRAIAEWYGTLASC